MPAGDKTKIVAAIPCLNTGAYISRLVPEAGKHVSSVVIIDDGSSDGTAGLAKEAGAIVYRHLKNRGYGGSIKSCFEAARKLEADILVILDGDGQHSPGEIPRLVAPILAGHADMVIGSRFCGGRLTVPGYRCFGIRVINLLFNFGYRTRVSDSQSGFRAYGRDVYKELRLSERGMSVSIETLELARRNGARVAEVPITCHYGRQNMNPKAIRHGLGVALSVVRIRLRTCFGGGGVKILFICEYYHPHIGGVEVVFRNLAEGMVRRGHRCCVLTCRLPGTPEREDINGVGVCRVRVPRRGARYWFSLLSVIPAFRLAGWADIVHTTTYNAAIPAFLAARLRRRKCAITIHEFWGRRWRELSGAGFLAAGAHRLVENIIVRLPFDARIAVSHYTGDCLKKAGIGGVRVIHNGIDNSFFKPGVEVDRLKLGLPPDAFIYTYYERPGASKGVEHLVRAVPQISRRLPGAVLLLILSHDPPSGYRRVLDLIYETGVRENVILLDPMPRESLREYIAASDCIIIPSLSEGFGFAAAEACAVGRPVVASNTGSLPEVVWGDCVLVKPGDPAAIAAGVETVCKGGVEQIPPKTFDWDDCVARYLETYKEVIAGG